ncbi:MAG: type II toxin-antitoxin system HicB family antitoxin [Holophaga sp.]|jgi:predicted RNase H-like HicB family nuclease
MRFYLAAVRKESCNDFVALFPGIPECVAFGSDTEELALVAADTLQRRLEACRDQGDPVPPPLSLEEARARDEARDAEFFLAVPANLEEGPPVSCVIALAAGLWEQVDRHARLRGLTRSGFLALAARREMRNEA